MSNGIPVEVFIYSMQWYNRQDLAILAAVNKKTSRVARDSLLQIVTEKERESRVFQIIRNDDIENVEFLLSRRPDLMTDYIIQYTAAYDKDWPGEENEKTISFRMQLLFLQSPLIEARTRMTSLKRAISQITNYDFAESLLDLNLPFSDRDFPDPSRGFLVSMNNLIFRRDIINLSLFEKLVHSGLSIKYNTDPGHDRNQAILYATKMNQAHYLWILLKSGPFSEVIRGQAYQIACDQENQEIMGMLDKAKFTKPKLPAFAKNDLIP